MSFTEKIVVAKISAKVMHSIKVMQFIFNFYPMYCVNFMSVTLVFQLEEVCGIKVVAHKMKKVSGGIQVTCV